MSVRPSPAALTALRQKIHALEGVGHAPHGSLPFGVPELDHHLPHGGLATGALHEVRGEDDGAAAAAFTAGIAGRLHGPVLWCATRADLFAPGLAQSGLCASRVIHVAAGDDLTALACMEEGLRHGGLAAVVAEVARLSMTASRRLHLAARGSGTMGIALRRGPEHEVALPTASMTRWRVSSRPSAPLPVPGLARARWRIELLRARAGDPFEIEVEACDAEGRLACPIDRDVAHAPAPRRAAG
ncbi:ImuA family protein [Falsirhodobacter halotolerans]|uniref:ImuA family protein n=1 Tax=Falsirhodobacter halotolerans TaxID=1146892 RepID=UPI001FD2220B|nr:damage-inducible protein [Falsirhodobacter halotolerans]MCJ8139874.1 damage-inducible protein [Falsirhodobacter halotolerans]